MLSNMNCNKTIRGREREQVLHDKMIGNISPCRLRQNVYCGLNFAKSRCSLRVIRANRLGSLSKNDQEGGKSEAEKLRDKEEKKPKGGRF